MFTTRPELSGDLGMVASTIGAAERLLTDDWHGSRDGWLPTDQAFTGGGS